VLEEVNDILVIATAEVYQHMGASPTEYHIQTALINMNSHGGHRMYLPVLVEFFHITLLFDFQNHHVFQAHQ
jgi:hypothetical protein